MSSKTKRKAAPWWKSAFLLCIIPAIIGASAALLSVNYTWATDEDDDGEPDIVYDDPPAPAHAPRQIPPAQRRLTGGAGSADALAKHFLEALAAGDETAIRSLRLTKEEFCDFVWPELESSKIPNLTCDFAWDQATLRSEGGLYNVLPEHKGKKYQLIAVRFEKGVEARDTYSIHRDARLRVKDEKGVEREVKLFGSVLELNGQFKLFSFSVD